MILKTVLNRTALAFLLALSSWAQGAEPVQVPCGAGNSGGDSKNFTGLRSCELVRPQIERDLQSRVQAQVDSYYQGCDLNPLAAAPAQPGQCQGRVIPKPTCNILSNGVPATFNKVVETEKDHNGAYCGDFTRFITRMSGTTCKVTPDRTGTAYMRESAYKQGAWVQALNCYHLQVRNEVDRGALTLTSVQAQPGPCAVMAQDFQEKRRQSDQLSKDLEKSLGGKLNVTDIDHCTGKEVASTNESADNAPGRLRQSACQIAAARAALEAMFNQLAVCEVFYRAQNSYLKFLGNAGDRDLLADEVSAAFNAARIMSNDDANCNNAPILSKYKPIYLSTFHKSADQYWSGSICQ